MKVAIMVTSFTPFAGYDVDGGGEVVVVADIRKHSGRAGKSAGHRQPVASSR